MWIICIADDSHEMSSFIFHVKFEALFSLKNNKINFRLLSTTNLLGILRANNAFFFFLLFWLNERDFSPEAFTSVWTRSVNKQCLYNTPVR